MFKGLQHLHMSQEQAKHGRRLYSGSWKCAIVSVPWRGSVSACLAWGDLVVKNMFEQVLKRLSLLRHHGTMMAHLRLPDLSASSRLDSVSELSGISAPRKCEGIEP